MVRQCYTSRGWAESHVFVQHESNSRKLHHLRMKLIQNVGKYDNKMIQTFKKQIEKGL